MGNLFFFKGKQEKPQTEKTKVISFIFLTLP